MWTEEVTRAALGVRRRGFEHTAKHQGGFLSQVCSSAELLCTLYLRTLQLMESDAPMTPRPFPGHASLRKAISPLGPPYHGPEAPHLDRLIIGTPSYSLAVLCALTQVMRLDGKALESYRADGSSLPLWGGEHSPGFSLYGSPPGSSLGVAAGVAMGRKLRGENGRVWVLVDADELHHGAAWEAISLLKMKPLNNLVIVINSPYRDEGQPQVDGVLAAAEASHWRVERFDGHDPVAIDQAAQHYGGEGPLLLCAQTHPCQGMLYLSLAGLPLDFVRFKDSRERMQFEAALRSELYQPGLGRR